MKIRTAQASDCDQVAEVDSISFTDSGFGVAHNMAQDRAFQAKRRADVRGYCSEHPDWVFVAVEDDRIVGFASIEYDPQEQAGEIDNNGVVPAYRNRGISTQLVRHAVGELKRLGVKHIKVHTVHVPAARRVYEKAGFTLVKQVQEQDSEGGPLGLGCYYEMHF